LKGKKKNFTTQIVSRKSQIPKPNISISVFFKHITMRELNNCDSTFWLLKHNLDRGLNPIKLAPKPPPLHNHIPFLQLQISSRHNKPIENTKFTPNLLANLRIAMCEILIKTLPPILIHQNLKQILHPTIKPLCQTDRFKPLLPFTLLILLRIIPIIIININITITINTTNALL